MPELPEVETIRAQLDPVLAGRSIVDAWAFDSQKFLPALLAVGATLEGVRRRGKYLLAPLRRDGGSADELVVHLGMTGRLWVQAPVDGEPEAAHLRAVWTLDDGSSLCFDDVRRFGRVAVVSDRDYRDLPTLAMLGPEPFDDDFDAEHLRRSVNASSRAVKTQLLSQRVVAGVGNIYADEALWMSRVRPTARRLTRVQAADLRAAIVDVLRAAIRNGGTTLRNYRDASGGVGSNQFHLQCYGRAGEPCLRCGEPLRRTVIDARSTTWCSTCQ